MEDLIRIGAAASALGVSVDTLRRWERDGRVSFGDFPYAVRFTPEPPG
jgi:predicted site-specific integrase-resolvase